MRAPLPHLLLGLFLGLAGCDQSPRFTQAEPAEALSAGNATVFQHGQNAFSMPSANLSPSRRLDFSVGNSFFRNPWVTAPATTTARDGLGPLFNTNACQNCHIKDGRGHPPAPDAVSAVSMLVRLSLPAGNQHAEIIKRLGVLAEPTYGGQLQDMANPGVAPEGKVRVSYNLHSLYLADGSAIELRQPQLEISQLGYGPLHADTRFSARIAPPMIGLGLLEAIPEAAILANADPDDSNGDGISGRANRVWDDALEQTVLGRFGWKAGQPTLNQQNAHAFAGDMGLTSSLLAADDCMPAQSDCRSANNGGEPDVSDSILASVLFYSRNLGVPARRDVEAPAVLEGKSLFHQAGCQRCHSPQFTTAGDAAEPELANQLIRPYTDLLLHDMGEGLADNRREFLATGQEWRTPPLWGIGLTARVSGHTQYLHDGRARNLLEAIAWHGGEAETAKQQVLTFSAQQRAALLAFLNSL
ncbi:di-heme oxidoredictase family protein [Pseudomonas sp. SA3-5]|uniref:Di-heme oxidoredictase family protein n=1 Tax=Pseudomonas aestuarii TaxID=3018340 RepID=A0ABT4XA85_9PSED|nr:di-heme oxidoredictase family protein [Pseudomonas aestuarii]MDA7085303.1 di-heme oxidoredictase family protein [Pseudomonas aestuarii]